MSFAHLRNTRTCRCAVLCLLLSWCVAFASPLIKPTALHLVCGTAGLELITQSDTPHNDGVLQVLGQDCTACLPIGLPPGSDLAVPLNALPTGEPGNARHPFTPAYLLPVPPARGPPLFVPDLT